MAERPSGIGEERREAPYVALSERPIGLIDGPREAVMYSTAGRRVSMTGG